MDEPNLRQRFEALRTAIAAKDRSAVESVLREIDTALEGTDPLTRAAAYAEVLMLRGRPLEAAQVLDDVLAVMGDDARIHHQVGVYRERGGQLERALNAYTRATKADPMFAPAWLASGVLLDRDGRPDEALLAYRGAMLADPQHVDTWRNMGNALAALRRFDEAASAYDTALGLAVGDQTIAFLRASAHAAMGDLETADRLLTEQMRLELGRPMQERLGDVVCRFFAPASVEDERRERARALLRAEVLPEGVRTAEFDAVRYVCDPDPVAPDMAHRFFDASTAVATRSP